MEGQTGPGDEVFYGTRNYDFARAGERRNAGSDVHGDSHELLTHDFAFACVYHGSHLDPSNRTVQRSCMRTGLHVQEIETGQQAAAGGVDAPTAAAGKFATQ